MKLGAAVLCDGDPTELYVDLAVTQCGRPQVRTVRSLHRDPWWGGVGYGVTPWNQTYCLVHPFVVVVRVAVVVAAAIVVFVAVVVIVCSFGKLVRTLTALYVVYSGM